MQGQDTYPLSNLPIPISSADSHCSLSRTPRQQFNPQGKLRKHKHGRPWEGARREKQEPDDRDGPLRMATGGPPTPGSIVFPIRFDIEGFAFARLSDTHLPRVFPRALHPTLTTTALYRSSSGWLRPAPESRSRGTYPHLLCSFTTRISFHLLLLPCFCSTHRVPLLPFKQLRVSYLPHFKGDRGASRCGAQRLTDAHAAGAPFPHCRHPSPKQVVWTASLPWTRKGSGRRGRARRRRPPMYKTEK
jgi:hypothetical protein